jgi:site-specific recombinase XerD
MEIINWIVNYRRFLKRRNYSPHTISDYMSTLRHFVLWLDVSIEDVTNRKIQEYIDVLLGQGLQPKTINCYLDGIRGFYGYLRDEEGITIPNPVKKGYALRLPRPLPRYLRDEEVGRLFEVIKKPRDRAIFMLMLRCGLRLEEVANLTIGALDLKQRKIIVAKGKGGKGRVVYISNDALDALVQYLRVRISMRTKNLFLVEKGTYTGKSISVRGIRKRMEYYAGKARLKVCCHQLRHTMATQLLNADADLVTIQDLLGHTRIKTTQRYCTVSNLKVQRDYFKAMEEVMRRSP